MKHTRLVLLGAILLLWLPFQMLYASDSSSELLKQLQQLPGISDIRTLKTETYAEKYVFFIEQLLDPKHPEAGSFQQRVILGHTGFDRPTVLVTEGYAAHYATSPRYREELTQLLDANLVFVEYRYFGQSMPKPCQWDYLTVENSLYDLHRVNTTLKALYPKKWVATGISKGGQTTMFYRTFFPDDVAVSVPYVAPLNRALEDGRHEPFLQKVGTAEERKKIEDFQLEVLKRKKTLLPMFEAYCAKKKYTFRVPLAEAYDFNVLEYSFAIWQWGTPVDRIPATTADDQTLFKHFIGICEPSYFSEQATYPSFNVQAAKELGYYGYDIQPFRPYLTLDSAKDYMHRVMLPAELSDLAFDDTLYQKTTRFLKENDLPMIFIYGEVDPWTASGVTWLKDKQQMKVYIQPRGSHYTRIGSFDEATQKEILDQLKAWLKD